MIGCVSKQGMNVRRSLVKNPGSIAGCRRAAEVLVHHIWWVAEPARQDCDFILVVIDTETATNDQPVLRLPRQPRKTKLWAEVVFLRIVERSAYANPHAREEICALPES